jgi:alkylation response protein AidB-like acyl-CoA dehydrogenase
MDFTFDEVQDDLRALAARIVGSEVTTERLRELEAGTDRIDRRLWGELAKANLLGIAVPERLGGMGYGIMELAIVLEEIGRNVAPVPVLATLVLGALPVTRLGTDEQQARLLPGVVDGTTFLTAALEEAGNPDIRRPATTARRDGDAWVLHGEKVAVPWGLLASTIVVSATTDDGEPALFLVDGNANGVTRERSDGTHREPQAQLTMRGVSGELLAVGADALEVVEQHALAGLCAMGVGLFDRAIRITAGYIAEREQFGKPLATFQGATLRAADAYIDTQAISVTTWSAIWRLAEGRPAADALAIAKFWVADGGQRVAHACQHLHGGMGVDIDYPIHRYFLWAKELELRLGSATAQLLRLGESMAGV